MATIDETAERFEVQSVTGERMWLERKVRYQGAGKSRKVVKEWYEAPGTGAVAGVEEKQPGVFTISLPHATLTYRRMHLPLS